MPVWANFTLIGPGPVADIPADGNGAVLRRGTGGTLFNGIMGRWKGIALDVRDTLTKQQHHDGFAQLCEFDSGAERLQLRHGRRQLRRLRYRSDEGERQHPRLRLDRIGRYLARYQSHPDGTGLDSRRPALRRRPAAALLFRRCSVAEPAVTSVAACSRRPTSVPPIRREQSGGRVGPRTTSIDAVTLSVVLTRPAFDSSAGRTTPGCENTVRGLMRARHIAVWGAGLLCLLSACDRSAPRPADSSPPATASSLAAQSRPTRVDSFIPREVALELFRKSGRESHPACPRRDQPGRAGREFVRALERRDTTALRHLIVSRTSLPGRPHEQAGPAALQFESRPDVVHAGGAEQ